MPYNSVQMATRLLAFLLISIWAFVTISVPASVLWHPFSMANREGTLFASFEGGTEGWSGNGVSVVSSPSRIGSGSLRFEWQNGKDTSVYAPLLKRDEMLAAIVIELYLEEADPAGVVSSLKPILFFKNKDGDWYQAFGTPLQQGAWNTFRVDVSATSLDLQPVHQGGAWDGQARRECDMWGIALASSELASAVVYIDNVRMVSDRLPYWGEVYSVVPGPSRLSTYELYELSFQVSPFPVNPFDPNAADLWGVVVAPDKSERRVPAFFYRPYRRVLRGAEESLLPDGSCCFKVRYTPVTEGKHDMYIAGKVMGRNVRSGPITFEVQKQQAKGFVRVSKKDPTYFEFENGEHFYPIGHNFRSPNDPRTARLLRIPTPPDRGTFRYDEILPKMAEAGQNSFEVWMASWFAEIEWVHRWKQYYGLGDYNLANAWKLDTVIEKATSLDLFVHLVIDNHGKYSSNVDAEWRHSPYNIENGGFLRKPEEFFENRKAIEHYKNKLRYIIARWGYSPNIFGYELVSELDLTGSNIYVESHKTSEVYRWHKMAAEFIKQNDVNQHLVTTHYSGTYKKIDPVMAKQSFIEYLVGDAYREGGDIVALMTESASRIGWGNYKKPYFITEYGGSPWGDSVPGLLADLHCGIWASYMTNMAGTPYFWWFDLIDREDWYYHFKALAEFHKGESRIGKVMKTRSLAIKHATGNLAAISLCSNTDGYAYVYQRSLASNIVIAKLPEISGAVLTIPLLDEGTYDYELWNTWSGKVISSGSVTTTKKAIDVPLSDFKGDIALKFKLRGKK